VQESTVQESTVRASATRRSRPRLVVLGGGVSGLTCGIRLLEAGHPVALWARELSPHTTSDVAAAVWYPYAAWPRERVMAWAARTREVLEALAAEPASGVWVVEGVEVLSAPAPEPWWRPCVPSFRRARPGELPPGFVDGYAFEAPVVEMGRYLPFLLERFRALGGTVERREVRSLEEAWASAAGVVNCTGLGARALVGDEGLFPIRGEVLRVERPPEGRFLLDEDAQRGMAYVIPRGADCILGGTAEEGNWSLEPSPQEAAGILARTARLLPPGFHPRVLQHRVGLRPGRASVRLETERHGDRWVVHDYGHGGAGVTLSWGCAEEVVARVAGCTA
jgi:D-amino-acid oxidase